MPETTNGTLPSSYKCFDIQLVMGMEISKTFPDGRGSVMGRNLRDKLYKKSSKCQVERKNIW